MKITPLSEYLPHQSPLLIAGPCSAESEEQVLSVAHALNNQTQVKVFRAGIWKPRTSVGSFEGLGAEALPWLQRVKKKNGAFSHHRSGQCQTR